MNRRHTVWLASLVLIGLTSAAQAQEAPADAEQDAPVAEQDAPVAPEQDDGDAEQGDGDAEQGDGDADVEPAVADGCESWAVQGPTEAPSRRQLKRAARSARAAAKSCARKRWKRCVRSYKASYERSGQHEHLRRLGEAYEGLGEREGAICVFGQFVASSEDAVAVAEVATQVDVLRATVAEEQRKQAEFQAQLDQAMAMDCTAWAVTAPTEKISRKARREARKLSRVARKQCKARAHDDCIESLRSAYSLDGSSAHLAGLADAYHAAGKLEAAICSYTALLAAAPDAKGADQTRRTVVAMHGTLEEEKRKLELIRQHIQKASELIDCEPFALPAPTGKVSARHKVKARRHFKRAGLLCADGEYQRCGEALKQAFQLDGELAHLQGMAYVYEQLNNEEGAICSYRQIQDGNPAPKLAAVADKKLAILSKAYNEARETKEKVIELDRDLAQTRTNLTKTAEILEQEAKQREQVEKKAETLESELSEVESESAEMKKWIKVQGRSTKGSLKRHFGTALLGLGSLGVGFGVLYGLQARRASNDLSTAKEWTIHFDALIGEAEADNTKALILSSVGGAALVAGGILYYLGEMASRNVEVQVEVDAAGAPAGASLWFGGSF